MKKNLITPFLVVLASLMLVSGTALAQDWDGGDATNNDDGTSDSTSDTSDTSDTSSTDSDSSWDGGEATNDDDGGGSADSWDGGEATNNDDGGSTGWDGGSATNNDDKSASSSSGSGGGGEINNANITVLEPKITAQIPDTVKVGETVDVKGHVDYPRNKNLEVLVDGYVVQKTTLNDAYDFNTKFTVDEAGERTVELRTKDAFMTKQLYATTGVDVSNIRAPSSVNSGRNVDVCADVSSVSTPEVSLNVDGTEVASQSGTGNVCFETSMSEGSHTVSVTAEVAGDKDSETTVITVRGSGSDTTVSQDLSERPRGSSSAGIFQSLVNMLVSVVTFVAHLVPIS